MYLCHDELLDVNIVRQRHAAGVDAKNSTLCLCIRQWELDLAINATRPDKRRIQRIDSVRCHDDLQLRRPGLGGAYAMTTRQPEKYKMTVSSDRDCRAVMMTG